MISPITLQRMLLVFCAAFACILCTPSQSQAVSYLGNVHETTAAPQLNSIVRAFDVDASGNAYKLLGGYISVPNGQNDADYFTGSRIVKYNSSGSLVWDTADTAPTFDIGRIASTKSNFLGQGFAVDAANNRVFVADQFNKRVAVFNATTGAFIRAMGIGVATGADQQETCTSSCLQGLGDTDYGRWEWYRINVALALDSTGNVYVSNISEYDYSSRVHKYNAVTGSLITTITVPQQVWSFAVDNSGKILSAKTSGAGINRYNSDGSFDTAFATTGFGGQFQPFVIAVNRANGTIVTSTEGFNSSQVDQFITFNSSGVPLQVSGGTVYDWGHFMYGFKSCAAPCTISTTTSGNHSRGIRTIGDKVYVFLLGSLSWNIPDRIATYDNTPNLDVVNQTGNATDGQATTATFTFSSDVSSAGTLTCKFNGVTVSPCASTGTSVAIPAQGVGTKHYTMQVTGVENGKTSQKTADYTLTINPVPPAYIGSSTLKITGKLKTGKVLSVSNSRSFWSGSTPTFNYQWYRCSYKKTNCDTISGANKATFKIPTTVNPTGAVGAVVGCINLAKTTNATTRRKAAYICRKSKMKSTFKVRVTAANAGGSAWVESGISKRIACTKRCR